MHLGSQRGYVNNFLEKFLRLAFADGFPADVGEAGILEEGGVGFFDGEQLVVERRVADDVQTAVARRGLQDRQIARGTSLMFGAVK